MGTIVDDLTWSGTTPAFRDILHSMWRGLARVGREKPPKVFSPVFGEKPGKTGINREKLGKTGNNWEKLGKTQN